MILKLLIKFWHRSKNKFWRYFICVLLTSFYHALRHCRQCLSVGYFCCYNCAQYQFFNLIFCFSFLPVESVDTQRLYIILCCIFLMTSKERRIFQFRLAWEGGEENISNICLASRQVETGWRRRGGFTLNVILSRYLYFNMETFPMLGWGRKGTQ